MYMNEIEQLREQYQANYVEYDAGYNTPCWIWVKGKSGEYGVKNVRQPSGHFKAIYVHRLHYEEYIGAIPAGHHIHHKCDVKLCCNPEHLEAKLPVDHTAITRQANIEKLLRRLEYRLKLCTSLTDEEIAEVLDIDKLC